MERDQVKKIFKHAAQSYVITHCNRSRHLTITRPAKYLGRSMVVSCTWCALAEVTTLHCGLFSSRPTTSAMKQERLFWWTSLTDYSNSHRRAYVLVLKWFITGTERGQWDSQKQKWRITLLSIDTKGVGLWGMICDVTWLWEKWFPAMIGYVISVWSASEKKKTKTKTKYETINQ